VLALIFRSDFLTECLGHYHKFALLRFAYTHDIVTPSADFGRGFAVITPFYHWHGVCRRSAEATFPEICKEANPQGFNRSMFKKLISSAIMTSIVALTIPFSAITAEAHPGCRTHRHSRTVARRTTYRSYQPVTYYTDEYGNRVATYSTTTVKRPSYYARHRRLVNTAAGAGVGALIGGLLGGRRGVALGLLGGGLGSQVFTHYQRPRNYTRVRY